MEHRDGDADHAVDGKFFQDARVKHGGGGRRGGITGRRPGMEGKETDEDTESDQEEEKDDILLVRSDGMVVEVGLESDHIEGARRPRARP